MVLTLAPIWCWCWSINFGALGARTFGANPYTFEGVFGVGTFGAYPNTFEEGVFGVGTFGANPNTFEEGVFGVVRFDANPHTFEECVWCNWIRCTKCNFQMVQQVNGAFYFFVV